MRLLLITRQFWPSIGGAQIALANLAAGLCEMGADVTVLTARWHRSWPSHYQHGQVRVIRLPQPVVRYWGTMRYMNAVQRWLRRHQSEYDLVYVSMLKHEAYVAIRALAESGVPVVLRPEGAGVQGDIAWHEHARFGHTIRRVCQQAAALVAIAPAVREELIATGFTADRIHEIANGVEIPEPRDDMSRDAARAELAASDRRLELPAGTQLVIYVGRLHEAKGLRDLVDAWATVTRQIPAARLWIVGDGPERGRLVKQIEEAVLTRSVTLTGSYDSTAQFHQAADVFAFPSRCELMSLALLEAMAAGMMIVASDIPGNRLLLDGGQCGLLVPNGDTAELAMAIQQQLKGGAAEKRMRLAARERAQECFSLSRMTLDHYILFKQLLNDR